MKKAIKMDEKDNVATALLGLAAGDEVVDVASGKLTTDEQLGFYNFAVWKRDPRLEAVLGLKQP
jgi:altronate dehydratase